MNKEAKTPGIIFSIITIVLVVSTIVVCLSTGLGAQMSIFYATIIVIMMTLILKNRWNDIQSDIVASIEKSIPTILILFFVGMLVGIWTIGGTLPSLIYYGLNIISPSIIVPLTFILCALTSIFTGTSFGSIATMGLVLYSIGINMGIPTGLIAGAVVSGACFGDKMSPMSDTTNLASTMAGTDLYEHIQSMLYTTVPASIVVLVLYFVLGMPYGGAAADISGVKLITDTLEQNFDISVVTIIPIILLLVLSAKKISAVLAMGITTAISIILAIVTQGVSLKDISGVSVAGYISTTGIETIDKILSRGGISSMFNTVVLIIFASAMGGVLMRSGVIKVLIDDGLMKFIRSRKSLVLSTMGYCYSVMLLTGNQSLGIVLPGQTMASSYDKFDTDRKVLSRTLEDTATISGALIPWSSFSIYICGVLSIGIEYIPFAFLNYIVPIFSILCAITGFGIWNSKGEKVNRKVNRKVNISKANTIR